MDYKALNDQIKKEEFKRVYLFYGPERYMLQFYENRLIRSAMAGSIKSRLFEQPDDLSAGLCIRFIEPNPYADCEIFAACFSDFPDDIAHDARPVFKASSVCIRALIHTFAQKL